MAKKSKKEPPASTSNALADPENQWADQPKSAAHKAASKFRETVVKAYDNKDEQANLVEEYWAIFNATPDDNQQYQGNTQGYIPAVRDALHARAKRALKQLFPANHRYVDGLASDDKIPYTQLALIDYYVRRLDLKSFCRTLLLSGDVTGQWTLALDWSNTTRTLRRMVKKNPTLEGIDGSGPLEINDPETQEETIEEEEVETQLPEIVEIATEDLVVIPPTCADLQKAKAVAIRLRMSPDTIQQFVDDKIFVLPENTDVEGLCIPNESKDKKNPQKRASSQTGVKTKGTDKHAVVFMTYMKLELDGKDDPKAEAVVFYWGEEIIGIIRNPLWSGKRPVISAPVERLAGAFFGQSKIEPVKFLQWGATDYWNMGQDSAMYSLLPIFAVDPLKQPAWQSLVMGLAAIWPVEPDGIKQIQQQQMWKEAMQIVTAIKSQIWESLEVNEMMMGKMPAGRKNNQLMAGVAQEQQTNITDHATRFEEVILNPLVEFLFEFDQQFRTDDIMIASRGAIGYKAKLEVIPPQEWGARFQFRWNGTDAAMGSQRIQQGIGLMNVLKGIPPQMLGGKRLDITPIIEAAVENLFGPELAPKILVDERNMYTVPPEVENEMLHNMFPVETHESDDDMKHIPAHMQAAGQFGDPAGLFKMHLAAHAQQLQRKREMAMAQQQQQQAPKGMPGGPGGGGQPGVAGAPRPGAIPAPGGPRPMQQPPGAVGGDQMADPNAGGRG